MRNTKPIYLDQVFWSRACNAVHDGDGLRTYILSGGSNRFQVQSAHIESPSRTASTALRLQIPQQPLKRLLVAVAVFPAGEVGNKILSDLSR